MRPKGMFGGWALIAAAVTIAGCDNAELQQELDFAQSSVKSALEVWKRGETAESLKSGSAPIEFYDDDWQHGARLLDYQIVRTYHESDGAPRCAVSLTIQRGEGQPEQVQAAYQVNAQPKVVIARDPMS